MDVLCVSIIMPVYNGEKYVQQSIKSLVAQTFMDFELIIVDDGSTDGTAAILDSFTDSRIKRLSNPTNMGLVVSLNRGIAQARGKYIARQDADDLSFVGRLVAQVDYLENHQEVGLLGSWAAKIDERGNVIGSARPPCQTGIINWKLLFSNCFVHTSVMLRRKVFERVGYYSSAAFPAEDYDLWWRVSTEFEVANLPEVLVSRRISSSGIVVTHQHLIRESAISVIHHAVNNLLGDQKPRLLAESLYLTMEGFGLSNNGTTLDTARLIVELHDRYLEINSPNESEVNYITKDAANKLYFMAGRNLRSSPTTSFKVALLAAKMDPRPPSLRTILRLATNSWRSSQ